MSNNTTEIHYTLLEAANRHKLINNQSEAQYAAALAHALLVSGIPTTPAATYGILQSYAEQISRDWSTQAGAQPDALPAFVASHACRLLPPDAMSPAAFQEIVAAVAEAIPAHDDLSPPAEVPLIETCQVPAAGVCP